MTTTSRRLSVAIPVFNEEGNVTELVRRVMAVLDTVPGGPHELVLVDDGSSDRTATMARDLAASDARLMVITLSRNFGHQVAVSAALDHVTGDVIAVMDGDLQDPPEVLPQLLAVFDTGYDVVFATRTGRKEGWLLRTCYNLFYRLIDRLSSLHMPLDAGDFSIMSHRVVEVIRRAPERQRYVRGLRTWAGFRQIGVPVVRGARHAGESKYSVRALVRLAFDGIFAFSTAPIRAAAVVGALAIALSSAFAAYSIIVKLVTHAAPRGFTATVVIMIFLSGVQLLFLGVVGEYVGRIYEETKRRPLYVVDQITQHPDAKRPRATP